MTGRTQRIENRFERALWASRLIVLAGVIVSALLAVGALVLATIDAVRLIPLLLDYAATSDDDVRTDAVTAIVKSLDGYLIAALLIVVALGLYELFVNRVEPAEASAVGRRLLRVRDLEDLKQRVGKLVVLVLIGEFLQQALQLGVDDHVDLVLLSGGIVLVAAALFLTGRASGDHGYPENGSDSSETH